MRIGCVAWLACACAASGGNERADPGDDETGARCSDAIDNDRDGLTDCDEASCAGARGCAGTADGGARPRSDATCESIAERAETALAPVDIVWIVDGSSSMSDEGRLIQDNMNRFAAAIGTSGIDYRVVVVWNPTRGYVVPPPLGSDPARLLIVGADVNSDEGLSDLLEHFPMYRDFLRPSAITHFVIVTDDESGIGWGSFQTQMSSLLGHAFTAHAIVSPPGSSSCAFPIPGVACGCSGPYGDAFADGEEYWQLAAATGGRQISICSADWSSVFDLLATSIAVSMPVPCEFAIPPAPDGLVFDRAEVNVVYTPGGGASPVTLPYVSDAAACAGEGWYYDDAANPTRVLLCPSACSAVSADETGQVDIAFGCGTLVI